MKIDKRPAPVDFDAQATDSLASAAPELQPQKFQPPEPKPPAAWPIWTAAGAVSVGWALMIAAFSLRFGPLRVDPLALAPLLGLWVGPVAMVWAAAGLMRQSQKLSLQSHRAERLADAMAAPALAAVSRTGAVVDAVRAEISAASAAADDARRALLDLQISLASEGQALLARTQEAANATQQAMAGVAQAACQSADDHVAAARTRVDELSEAAFQAGRKANQVFEARLADAQALVERSGVMVEQTAAAGSAKLAATAAAAQVTLEDLDAMIGEVEARAGRLPQAMRVQSEQVRAAMVRSLGELAAQARRTADEAQSIDSAIQERVRRNFEMLSETVRLMGLVASAPGPAAPVQEAASGDPVEEAEAAADDVAALAEEWAQRPRLRLAPTERDAAVSSVFRPQVANDAVKAAPDEDEPEEDASDEAWSWTELLASLEEPGGEPAELAESLTGELLAMSIDPAELLPSARVVELAELIRSGDAVKARDVVRRLAPAAVRRLSRRVLTDEALKRRAQAYLTHYRALTDDAADAAPALLETTSGRLFLLLDAAAGDIS